MTLSENYRRRHTMKSGLIFCYDKQGNLNISRENGFIGTIYNWNLNDVKEFLNDENAQGLAGVSDK